MTVQEGNIGELQSLSLIRYVVTFLIGSGGTGAAIALVGKEDFQNYGLITLAICLLAALILIAVFIYLESSNLEISRSKGLRSLNELYIDSLQTVGEFLVRGKPDDSKILRALARDLKNRAENQTRSEKDSLNAFKDGVNAVATHWENLATNQAIDDPLPIQDS